MNENIIHGIEQGRATFAYNKVKKIADLNPNQDDLSDKEARRRRNLQRKYKTSAKKLPVLIKTNGLGQALAYIQTRNVELYGHLTKWLRSKELIGAGDLVGQVIRMKSSEYRRITTETLTLLNWVRRFVDGLMPKVEADNDDFMDDVEEDNA